MMSSVQKPHKPTLGSAHLIRAATQVLAAKRAVMSLINKWAGTSPQDVTHSSEAVLSPLMTINVNRTISAHPLKCLAVDGLLVDRSAILICRLIQTRGGWPLFLGVGQSFFIALLSLYLSLESLKGSKI